MRRRGAEEQAAEDPGALTQELEGQVDRREHERPAHDRARHTGRGRHPTPHGPVAPVEDVRRCGRERDGEVRGDERREVDPIAVRTAASTFSSMPYATAAGTRNARATAPEAIPPSTTSALSEPSLQTTRRLSFARCQPAAIRPTARRYQRRQSSSSAVRSSGVSTSPGSPRSSQGTSLGSTTRSPSSGTLAQRARARRSGWPRTPP